MRTEPEPNLVHVAVVGAQKCGTTSLAAVLDRHPQLCLAQGKEAHAFDQADVQRSGVDRDRFEYLFAHRQPGQMLVDATPSYLFLPGCLEALMRHNPEVKVVVLLRPAGERAVSQHRHERRRGVERWPLLPALLLEPWRLRRDKQPLAKGSAHRVASYVARGRFEGQLRHLLSLTDRVHVTTLDSLVGAPDREMAALFEFLGVEPMTVTSLPRLNTSDRPGSRTVSRLLGRLLRSEMAATSALLGWSADRLVHPSPGAQR